MNMLHINRTDLNLFVVFDTIMAEGGITRASRRLHLSQPAISHALGRLRAMFDDPLFVRHGHAMTPTPLARQMAEPVRQALARLERTLNRAERFDAATAKKRFTIAMRDGLELALLPRVMREVTRAAPGVDIATVRADRREIEGELAAGTLDLVVDVLLPLPDEVRRQRLGPEKIIVLARPGHPALKRGLDLDTYLAQEHIVVTGRRRGLSAEDYELGRHNLSRRVRLRCQHYFAACRVVQQTDLLLTMPEHYARLANALYGNRALPFPLPSPGFDPYLYWHANAENDPANTWLRNLLQTAQREEAIAQRQTKTAKRKPAP